MRTPFGSDWESLSLGELRSFLADAGPNESLSWEAKSAMHAREVARQVGGFANTVRGGYLVVGAEWIGKSKTWTLPGQQFPGNEPQVWISSVIFSSLSPRPPFDVKPWEIAPGQHVAVVRVEPVSIPPCITSEGGVFERLPGHTVPVRTHEELARLFGRGEEARARAIRAVTADIAVGVPAPLRVALTATGSRTPYRMALFTDPVIQAMRDQFRGALRTWLGTRTGRVEPQITTGQSTVAADNLWARPHEGFELLAIDSGAVVVKQVDPDMENARALIVQDVSVLGRAWRSAASVAEAMTGYGPTVVQIVAGWPTGGTTVNLWTDEPTPNEADLEAARRQLARSSGIFMAEPTS